MTTLDERALEQLRRDSGLSIDLEGRLCHRGEPITHRRTLAVLWGSLARTPDGCYQVRVGREKAYVRVDDAPYGVRGVDLDAPEPLLHLTDGTVEPLAPATLTFDRDGVLHCVVKDGHRARFTRTAQVALGLAVEEDAAAPGRLVLKLRGRSYPIHPE